MARRVMAVVWFWVGWALMRLGRVYVDFLFNATGLGVALMGAGQRLTARSFRLVPPSMESER